MIKIQGHLGSINVQAVIWGCTELGIPHERVDRGGVHGGTQTEEYLRMNPNSLVPTLQDGDYVLWESGAINRYLSDRHAESRMYGRDPRDRGIVDQWMDWRQSAVIPVMGPLYMIAVRTSKKDWDAERLATASRAVERIWGILDRNLADRPFVAGSELSLADLQLGTVANRWYQMAIERPKLSHVEQWFGRLGERDGFKRWVSADASRDPKAAQ